MNLGAIALLTRHLKQTGAKVTCNAVVAHRTRQALGQHRLIQATAAAGMALHHMHPPLLTSLRPQNLRDVI